MACLTGLLGKIPSFILAAIDFAKDVINKVKSVFGISSPSSVFSQIGEDIIAGLKNGFSDAFDGFIDEAVRRAERFINDIKDTLGIGSPSSVFMDIGKDVSAGFTIGVNAEGGLMNHAMDIPDAPVSFGNNGQSNDPGYGSSGASTSSVSFINNGVQTLDDAREWVVETMREAHRRQELEFLRG